MTFDYPVYHLKVFRCLIISRFHGPVPQLIYLVIKDNNHLSINMLT